MWFGTDRGVSVYDGSRFTTYTTADGLPSNIIYKILQADDGAMWFGTYQGGASRFDGRRFRTYSIDEGSTGSTVSDILQDKQGRIYLRAGNGIAVLFNDSLVHAMQGSFSMFLHDGEVYVVRQGGISRIVASPDHEIDIRPLRVRPAEAAALLSPAIAAVTERTNGDVLLGGSSYVLRGRISSDRNEMVIAGTLAATLPIVYALFSENDSTVWAGTRSGLYRLTPHSLQAYKKEEGIDPEFIQAMYGDREGSLWLGTFGGGVKKFSNRHVVFHTIRSGLPAENVTAILGDSRGNIWLGGGHFLTAMNSAGKILFTNAAFSEVRSFAEDNTGRMYVGTFTNLFGPHRTDAYRNTALRRAVGIPYGASSLHVEGADLLIGSYGNGSYIFSNNMLKQRTEGMPSGMVEDIVPGYKSVWFLSHDNGATRLRNGTFERFSMEQGLPSNEIHSVLEDSTSIWFGTGAGLAHRFKGRMFVLDERSGLQGRAVLWIGRDAGSPRILWALTESSLHKLEDGRIESFGSSMLRPTPAASITRVHHRTSDNSLWIATTGGVAQIDLKNTRRGAVPPIVNIVRLAHDTVDVFSHLHHRGGEHPAIDLAYDQNNITIAFAGLSFVDEEDVRYRFKLEPLEADWSRLSRERVVRYRNLAHSSYTFSVLAVNGSNVISAQPATISFTISPPFWKRWWFIGSTALLLAGSFGGVVRYVSIRKLRKKVEELERERAIQAERERISRDLHDHVGAQLVNIISGLDLVGKYSAPAETRTQRLLQSLQRDARASMLQLRETIWAMKTTSMTMEKFAAQIEEYSRKQMESQDATTLGFASACDAAIELTPTQALNCFRFVQEALTNCVKHAQATYIAVRIESPEPDRIRISVRDNGVGVRGNASPSMEGNGVTNMRRRAEELAGVFVLESNGGGTEVRFEFPIGETR